MRAYVAVLSTLALLVLAGAAAAEPLDLKRYMPISEIEPGMTGVGKTTFEGSTIIEFQVRILAVLKNVGPKIDRIIVRCSGAGLEDSGIVAGMSGSPVYVNGRLIGAVAFAFMWGKAPIAGVQPIEQMLAVSDEKPWTVRGKVAVAAADARPAASAFQQMMAGLDAPEPRAVTGEGTAAFSVPVAALGLADLPPGLAGRETCDLQPIQTPVMVSGIAPRALERLRENLAPLGLVPMLGGGADAKRSVAARLEPGAPLAVSMIRGDMEAASMGTITEIVGDRLYGFGHALFGLGEADYPLMTGIGHCVIPSYQRSFRMGAAANEVGRLRWDEQTAIFGRLSKDRAPMVPMTVKVTGPSPGMVRTYRFEVVRQQKMTPVLAASAAANSLVAKSDLPFDHTVAYRVSIKPVGRPAIVRENLAVSPDGDMVLESQVRNVMGLLMDNPFRNLDVESVDVEAAIEPVSRMAEIQEVRLLRNSVRPGGSVPIDMKIRPWRSEPRWQRVDVQIPANYPDGTYRVRLCGAEESMRQEMREAPARFRSEDLDSLVTILRRDERRDQLFIRLQAPGEGLAIGRDELPNLPASMRAILSESARRQVSGVASPRVTKQPMPYVLQGTGEVDVTVNRFAPEP